MTIVINLFTFCPSRISFWDIVWKSRQTNSAENPLPPSACVKTVHTASSVHWWRFVIVLNVSYSPAMLSLAEMVSVVVVCSPTVTASFNTGSADDVPSFFSSLADDRPSFFTSLHKLLIRPNNCPVDINRLLDFVHNFAAETSSVRWQSMSASPLPSATVFFKDKSSPMNATSWLICIGKWLSGGINSFSSAMLSRFVAVSVDGLSLRSVCVVDKSLATCVCEISFCWSVGWSAMLSDTITGNVVGTVCPIDNLTSELSTASGTTSDVLLTTFRCPSPTTSSCDNWGATEATRGFRVAGSTTKGSRTGFMIGCWMIEWWTTASGECFNPVS